MKLEISNEAILPTKYGTFKIKSFKEKNKEHLAVYTENLSKVPIIRIHSECLTGDVFGSVKCDCGEQIDKSIKLISKEGGMIIYLRQEGRDIGLLNKVNAYSLQDKGYDTVEANLMLGFKDDERTYTIVEDILSYFNIEKINLISNNPRKLKALKNIEIMKRVPIVIEGCKHNESYLKIKESKLGHLF